MDDSIPISAKQLEKIKRVNLQIDENLENLTIFYFRETNVVNFKEK